MNSAWPMDDRPQPRPSGGEAPNWPVLARLPQVGEQAESARAAASAPIVSETLGSYGFTIDSSGLIDTHATAPPEFGPSAEVRPMSAHFGVESVGAMSPRTEPVRRGAIDESRAHYSRLAQQQLRVDRVLTQMHGFEPSRSVLPPAPQPPAPAPTLTGLIYRMYAATAPHAAMLVMAAMILSAGLLYWIAFGVTSGGGAPIRFDAPARWSTDSTGGAVAPRVELRPTPARDQSKQIQVAAKPQAVKADGAGSTLAAPTTAHAHSVATPYPALDFAAFVAQRQADEAAAEAKETR